MTAALCLWARCEATIVEGGAHREGLYLASRLPGRAVSLRTGSELSEQVTQAGGGEAGGGSPTDAGLGLRFQHLQGATAGREGMELSANWALI